MAKNIQWYGWRPDTPDARDLYYAKAARISSLKDLPPIVNLRDQMPAPYDQGQLGSCTANAIAGAVEFAILKEGKPDFMPSRLFIYYNERDMEGTVSYDSGAELRDGMATIAQLGVAPETEWPYDISQFTTKPSDKVYQDAKLDIAQTYFRLNQDESELKTCLASGFPFVFGFTVYDSFESPQMASQGILNTPKPNEGVLGGHAVCCAGYTDTGYYIVRNSWGTDWGINGYFLMSADYMHNPDLCSDFWTLRKI